MEINSRARFALTSAFPPSTYLALSLVFLLLYAMYKGLHRLYFHPLKSIPGPKFAAVTYWYEMYHDIYLDGQYTTKIKALHTKYGPVVRISPEEVHVSDPEFYNTIFAPSPDLKTGQASKRHKWKRFVQIFGHPELSAFGTTSHDKHKMRRGAMERFFSPAMVKKLAPTLILDKVETLCRRLQEEGMKGSVRIKLAFSCYTTDVITDYAIGRPFNYLNHPTFFPEWSDTYVGVGRTGYQLLKPWPFLFHLMNNVPESLAKFMNPGLAAIVVTNRESKELIEAIKAGKDLQHIQSRSHPSIFHELLNSDLPPEEKRVERLQGDGQSIIGAGTETTATILATAIVRILCHQDIETRLRKEILDVMPDPTVLPPLSVSEKLPYLNAVVRESLRLGYGIYGRCSRISDTALRYKDVMIPAGTPVSMTAGLIHTNPSIFPEPETFDPERWIRATGDSQDGSATSLYRYLVSFSKGPRVCIGINLAYAEIYMALAALFRRFDMRLDNTSETDLEVVADIFLPVFRKDQKELRVFITPTES